MIRRLAVAALICGLIVSVYAACLYMYRANSYREELANIKAQFDSGQNAAPVVSATDPAFHTPATQAPSPAPNVVPALKAHIRDLEQTIQSREAQILSLQQTVASQATNRVAEAPRPRRDQGAWMGDMKTNNPAQYEELVKRREEARNQTQNVFAQKAAYFLDSDRSAMNDEEKANYDQMIQLLDQTWRITEQMHQDLPQGQRRELMRTARQNMATLQPMLLDQRDKELSALGQQLGYNQNDASTFAANVNHLIDMTSVQNIFGNMHGGNRRAPSGAPPNGPPRTAATTAQ